RRSGIHCADSRWMGGVAAGYAQRVGISPILVRAAFILLTVFGGIGLVIYGIWWALLPEESDGRIHLQEAFAGRFDGALALAGAFTLAGLLLTGTAVSIIGLGFVDLVQATALVVLVGLLVAGVATLLRVVRRPAP